MSIAIGDRFVVAAKYEVKNAAGRHICNYLPDFDYGVTARNLEIVKQMIAGGVASIGTKAAQARATGPTDVQSGRAKLRGSVRVK